MAEQERFRTSAVDSMRDIASYMARIEQLRADAAVARAECDGLKQKMDLLEERESRERKFGLIKNAEIERYETENVRLVAQLAEFNICRSDLEKQIVEARRCKKVRVQQAAAIETLKRQVTRQMASMSSLQRHIEQNSQLKSEAAQKSMGKVVVHMLKREQLQAVDQWQQHWLEHRQEECVGRVDAQPDANPLVEGEPDPHPRPNPRRVEAEQARAEQIMRRVAAKMMKQGQLHAIEAWCQVCREVSAMPRTLVDPVVIWAGVRGPQGETGSAEPDGANP